MKRIVLLIAAAVVGISLFAGLVHVVLVAARVSEPAKDTVMDPLLSGPGPPWPWRWGSSVWAAAGWRWLGLLTGL